MFEQQLKHDSLVGAKLKRGCRPVLDCFQALIVSFRLKTDAHLLPVLNEHLLLHISHLCTFYSYWLQLLWPLLLVCSLILIATAHCGCVPMTCAANGPKHTPLPLKSQFRQMGKLWHTRCNQTQSAYV